MSPQRVGHATQKYRVHRALSYAISSAGLECHVVPDGVAVHVSDTNWYEPDAMVYCGRQAPDDDIKIENPLVVVEVASPSTVRLDETTKLAGYFGVSSVQHYLIVYPNGGQVIHHQRQTDGTILTRLVATGQLNFDPPGLTIDVADLF